MDQNTINEIVKEHRIWLRNPKTGKQADFSGQDLRGIDFRNITTMLKGAIFSRANLTQAHLSYADLKRANFENANLSGACLFKTDFMGANLSRANLTNVYAVRADFERADFSYADVTNINWENAVLDDSNFDYTIGLEKKYGFKHGEIYWKRFSADFCNLGYQFQVGRNDLRDGEEFAGDDRVICSYPGFHFASREWCAEHFGHRCLEAKICIPEDAQINVPWASNGKASASAIEILEVYDVKTHRNVTERYRNVSDGYGRRLF